MANSLGNYKDPYINAVTLKKFYSPVVKDNIFQALLARDGEACTEKYCEDTSVAMVSVLRVLPGNGQPRQIGEATNGGFFNGNSAELSETVAYGVKLLDVFDQMHDIPEVQQDMMSTDLAVQRAKIVGGQVARGVNACTLAAQIAKNFNAIYANDVNNLVNLPSSPTGQQVLNAIIEASAHLDDGDVENGVDTYPIEERAIFIKPAMYAKLMQAGAIIIGGSNYAQDILADGGVSHGDKSDNVTGYCGRILDMPVYKVSKPVWDLAAGYLGLAPTALDSIEAMVVSGTGTLRGLAFNNTIKQIDSPSGAGIRMQPLYRWGAECILASSVSIIADYGFSVSSGSYALVAPASRTLTVTFDANTGSGTQAAITKVYGDRVDLPTTTTFTKSSNHLKAWALDAAGTQLLPEDADTHVQYIPHNYGQKVYIIWEADA